MGAAQHYGIHSALQQGLAVFRHSGGQRRVIRAGSVLYHGRQQGTGHGGHSLSGPPFYLLRKAPAADGGTGGGQTHFSVSGGLGRRFGSSRHHIKAGNRQAAQCFACIAAYGAAGRDKRLDILPQQPAGQLAGQPVDLPGRTVAIGHPGGIPQVEDGLTRQQMPQHPHRHQSADTGIKNTDRSGVHGRRLLSGEDKSLVGVPRRGRETGEDCPKRSGGSVRYQVERARRMGRAPGRQMRRRRFAPPRADPPLRCGQPSSAPQLRRRMAGKAALFPLGKGEFCRGLCPFSGAPAPARSNGPAAGDRCSRWP